MIGKTRSNKIIKSSYKWLERVRIGNYSLSEVKKKNGLQLKVVNDLEIVTIDKARSSKIIKTSCKWLERVWGCRYWLGEVE